MWYYEGEVETALVKAQSLTSGLGFAFGSSYIKAGVIIALVFSLVLVLALTRRHFLDWSIKGASFGILVGFSLALILEGFLLLGGRTAFTELLGWNDAPKPIRYVLDLGEDRMAEVLGKSTLVPVSSAEGEDINKILDEIQSLTPTDAKRLRLRICEP